MSIRLLGPVPDPAGNLGKLLDDPSLVRGPAPALSVALAQDLRGAIGSRSWTAHAGVAAAVEICVYCEADDADPDAIFGHAPAQAGQLLPPLITATPGSAWIKYKLSGGLSARIAASAGAAQAQFSGSIDASLSAYCRSPAHHSLADALTAQRERLPFVLEAADMRALPEGDAGHVHLGGNLGARLQMRWADLLTGPLGALQALLPPGHGIAFSVAQSATVTASWKVDDSFRLAFVGVDQDWVRLSLQRTDANSSSTGAAFSASARLIEADLGRDLFSSLVAQLTGSTPAQVSRVQVLLHDVLHAYDDVLAQIHAVLGTAAASFDAAVDAQGISTASTRLQQLQALLTLVAGNDPALALRLGIPVSRLAAVVQQLDTLADTISARLGAAADDFFAALGVAPGGPVPLHATRALLDRLEHFESALTQVATQRIDLALSAQYRRLGNDETVLRALLRRDHPQFAEWHRAALTLDFGFLLEHSTHPGGGVMLECFLRERTLASSFSLALNLGHFFAEDSAYRHEWVETSRMVPAPGGTRSERSCVFSSMRSREETVLGTTSGWRGEFQASFHDVAQRTAADAPGRWRLSLALAFSARTSNAKLGWLQGAADYAALWGIVPEADVEGLAARFAQANALGRTVDLQLGHRFAPAAFDSAQLLKAIAQVSDDAVCAAFATALQRIDALPERCDIALRRQTYSKPLGGLLGKANIDLRNGDMVARRIARGLPPTGSAQLRNFEAQTRPANVGSVVDVVTRSGNLRGMIGEFRKAGALLALIAESHAGNDADRHDLAAAVAGWDIAWQDRYGLRWQVALLRQLAATAALARGASTAALRLVVTDASGQHTTHIFAAPAEPVPATV